MEPFYFDSSGRALFGVLHQPQGPNHRSTAIAICSPILEEKVRTYRIFHNLAMLLADRGFWVLRFDYRGDGDSEGEWWESSMESRRSDVRRALEILQNRSGLQRQGLLGLSVGGTIAALAAEEIPDVRSLILWHPVLDVGSYLYEALRSNLANQLLMYRTIRAPREKLVLELKRGGTVNVDGYPITGPFYEEAETLRLCERVGEFKGNLLLMELTRDKVLEDPGYSELLESYRLKASSATRISIPREFEWTEQKQYVMRARQLFQETLSWLEKTEGGSSGDHRTLSQFE